MKERQIVHLINLMKHILQYGGRLLSLQLWLWFIMQHTLTWVPRVAPCLGKVQRGSRGGRRAGGLQAHTAEPLPHQQGQLAGVCRCCSESTAQPGGSCACPWRGVRRTKALLAAWFVCDFSSSLGSLPGMNWRKWFNSTGVGQGFPKIVTFVLEACNEDFGKAHDEETNEICKLYFFRSN